MAAVLVIDTVAARCAAAVVCDGEVRAEHAEPMLRGHAERLFPIIDRVLARAGVSRGDLDRIAVCTGPGGFTGARIGVAAARGLALALGVPAIGVSWFEAIAADAGPGRITVVLSAPRAGSFAQEFQDGVALGPPACVAAPPPAGTATRPGPDPMAGVGLAQLARVAAGRQGAPRAAPLYLRPPDADPPRFGPPGLIG